MKTQEPVALINGFTALIEAAIALAIGFGLDLTPEQVGLVMAVVVATGNLLQTLWARAQVTPIVGAHDVANRAVVPARTGVVRGSFANRPRNMRKRPQKKPNGHRHRKPLVGTTAA